ILYLGGGCIASNCEQIIQKFSAITQIPAVETLMARGVLPFNNPNLLGMVGMHGSYCANMAMSESDLIIALGARFDDRVTGKLSEFAKAAQIVHIDIDPSSIGKIVNANYPIVGDIHEVLKELIPLLKDYETSNIQTWKETLLRYNKLHPLKYEDSDQILKPQWVIQKIGEMLGEKALIATDVGQHQMWAAQFYPFSLPRQFITSGGLGTMGFGLPAAMGAKKAFKEKISINISGDGSILMNIQEMITCFANDIPVINIILNNSYLGMVRQWQSFFYDKRFSHTDLSIQPDFVKLAESFGGVGFICHTKKEFEDALNEAIKSNKPALLDVRIDKFENVLPMVPTGGALFNMLLEYKE
ncbi:MAG: acetolactate synthase large subunit, partial [Helicobacter sp.]|nr:acetolactate synthase large subunit [Helicobacter sp.]